MYAAAKTVFGGAVLAAFIVSVSTVFATGDGKAPAHRLGAGPRRRDE